MRVDCSDDDHHHNYGDDDNMKVKTETQDGFPGVRRR